MSFIEKHLIKIYLLAGAFIAYALYIPSFFDNIVMGFNENGIFLNFILGIGLTVVLPIVFAYALWVLTLVFIPVFAVFSLFKESKNLESFFALSWVVIGLISFLLSCFRYV
jgi:hypothetical protein